MSNRILTALAALCALSCLSGMAHPDGAYIPSNREWRRNRERSLISEPDQKALVFFQNGREDLIISPSYQGNVHDFAWVVPVPDRPKVHILTGAPFHELAQLVTPAPPRPPSARAGMAAGKAAPRSVTVIERKTVGDYDVSVLAATDSHALTRWLAQNDYHLPARAEAPMRAYIREGWTFVASRIKTPRLQTSEGLQSGTLSPLRLTFAATRPIYPMRLSAANAGPFRTLIYVALPRSPRWASRPARVAWSGEDEGRNDLEYATLSPDKTAAYPTLAELSASGLDIFWFTEKITPEQCTHDYKWQIGSRSSIRR